VIRSRQRWQDESDRSPKARPQDPSQRGKPLPAEKAAYFALMNQGVGSREAARQVGINYRTAKRWQAAAKAARPDARRPRMATCS
jgi:transposase